MYNNEFLEKIYDKLSEKGLNHSSVKLYISNLKTLYKHINSEGELKDLKFLNNKEKVFEVLEKMRFSTKKTHLGGILSILRSFKTPQNNKNYKIYTDYLNELVENRQEDKNKKTETQEKNWKTMDEVKEIFQKLKDEVYEFINNKDLKMKQYEKLVSLLTLSLYVLQEPRRNKDYLEMYFCDKSHIKKDKKKNYVFKNSNGTYSFLFHSYKTSKKFGSQEFEVENPELNEIISKYLEHHPLNKGKKGKSFCVPFLVKSDGTHMNQINSITRVLNKVFGNGISSSMLRHIYLSDKFSDVLKQKQEVSEKMAHGLSTQKDYIKFD